MMSHSNPTTPRQPQAAAPPDAPETQRVSESKGTVHSTQAIIDKRAAAGLDSFREKVYYPYTLFSSPLTTPHSSLLTPHHSPLPPPSSVYYHDTAI
jgi:hypothetical protein